MSTTQWCAALDAVETALVQTPDATRRAVVAALETDCAVQPLIEQALCRALTSPERESRRNGAIGLQAVTLVWSRDVGAQRSIGPSSLGALIAALAVEAEIAPRTEQLWALSRQDYRHEALQPFAGIAARVFAAFVTTAAHIADELVDQLVYAYELVRPMVDDADLPGDLSPAPRDLLGYAATGIPFILSEPRNPKVVLIFNDNLQHWLPPGGHFNPGMDEVPSEALVRKIREETGARAKVIWNGQDFNPRRGKVEVSPAPAFVLLEDLTALPYRASTEIHRRHYDLNYICEILTEEEVADDCLIVELGEMPAEDPFSFVRERIEAKARELRQESVILDDVVERVVLSLQVLAKRDSRALFTLAPYRNGNGNGNTPHFKPERVERPLVKLGGANGHGRPSA